MPSPENSLAAAYLVIYILLLPFNIYTLIRHGRHGILGWLYLILFAFLRIIGAGLQLSDSSSKTAALINGIGLSPLTLAVLGVLHESSYYIRSLCSSNKTNNITTAGGDASGYSGEKTGEPFVLSALPYVIIHLVVGAAFALVIIGARKTPPDLGKERAGYFVFVVVWVVLVLFAGLAWMWRGFKGGRDARVVSVISFASITSLSHFLCPSKETSSEANIPLPPPASLHHRPRPPLPLHPHRLRPRCILRLQHQR